MGRVRHESAQAVGLPGELVHQINDCGFFPQLVIDSVRMTLGEEPVEGFLVQHEATFVHEGVSRHMSVLVLTATRLIVSHTDENHDDPAGASAISSTESVPLRLLGAVALSRVVAHPERFGTKGAQVIETWLSMSWQTVRKVDLEPASCADPTCDGDHGYTGSSVAEDMVIRMSPTADGERNVAQLAAFGTALQRRVG